jgi:peptide/nickel transport system permease protein
VRAELASPSLRRVARLAGARARARQAGRYGSILLGSAWLLAIVLVAVAGPVLDRISYETIDVAERLGGPSVAHPLGTDANGRDVLIRLVYGARISLIVGVVAAGVALGIGTAVGAAAGHLGGRADAVLMRLTDTFLAVPVFFFLLTLLAIFGAGLGLLIGGIGLTSWMGVARVVRSEILRFRGMEFVDAARAIGASERRVLLRHLLPHAVPSIIVAATLGVANAILVESALSYLGLGIQPPVPSWGNMLSGAQNYMYTAPQLALYPGVLILLTVVAFNVLGDGLRDALDPEVSGR